MSQNYFGGYQQNGFHGANNMNAPSELLNQGGEKLKNPEAYSSHGNEHFSNLKTHPTSQLNKNNLNTLNERNEGGFGMPPFNYGNPPQSTCAMSNY